MLTVIAIAIVAALLYRVSTPESRTQILHDAVERVRRLQQRDQRTLGPFHAALRARTARVPATLAIVALNVMVFAGLLFAKGSWGDPSVLLAWGASFGPQTTNGEWWRLITAPVLHPGLLTIFIDTAVLLQVGPIVERFVGPFAFAAVYASSGLLAGLATLTADPTGVTWGSAGALFGVYGALMVSTLRSWRDRVPFAVPRTALKRWGIGALVFVLHEIAIGGIAPRAAVAAFMVGLVFTLAFVVDVVDGLPPWRRVAWGAASTLALAAALAVPLRGIADVTPEIARLPTIEARTSEIYQGASAKFRRGALAATALAQIIDESIVPELQAADDRFESLTGVPRDDVSRVQDAREYLRLRSESWRLRAKALRDSAAPMIAAAPADGDPAAAFRANAAARYRSSTLTLGRAETDERAALDTLRRLTTPHGSF